MKKSHKSGAIVIEGHVQGLANTRALGEAGIPVVVIDKTNCIARYSKYCKAFFRCPEYDTEDFFVFLIQLAEKHSLKGWSLFPSNDHVVYTISKHKSELEDYYKVITPGLKIINNIYNKSNLISLAEKNEVPVPKTEYFDHSEKIQTNLQFPVLTKGKTGLSFYKAVGRKAYLAHDKDELCSQLSEIEKKYLLKETFTQELIPDVGTNKTISFTGFCVGGDIKAHWAGVKLREHPIQFGTATFCESIYQEECIEQSKTLLKVLNYTGVCEVEYLFDPRDNQYKLIEINPRTWLWVGLAKACGVNYPLMMFNYLNGLDFAYPNEYEVGLKWKNIWTDMFFSAQAIFKRKYSIKEYLKSFKGETIKAVFDISDIKPFIMMTAMLPYLILKR